MSSTKQQSTDRGKLLECKQCWGTNHSTKFCQWKGRAEPAEARGGSARIHGSSVKVSVTDSATSVLPLNPDLDEALSKITTTMHTITSQQDDCSVQLGPTLNAESELKDAQSLHCWIQGHQQLSCRWTFYYKYWPNRRSQVKLHKLGELESKRNSSLLRCPMEDSH